MNKKITLCNHNGSIMILRTGGQNMEPLNRRHEMEDGPVDGTVSWTNVIHCANCTAVREKYVQAVINYPWQGMEMGFAFLEMISQVQTNLINHRAADDNG